MPSTEVKKRPSLTHSSDGRAVRSDQTAARVQQASTGTAGTVGHGWARSEHSLPCAPAMPSTEVENQPIATHSSDGRAVRSDQTESRVQQTHTGESGTVDQSRSRTDNSLPCRVPRLCRSWEGIFSRSRPTQLMNTQYSHRWNIRTRRKRESTHANTNTATY
jgi:hypothetical protein